MHLLGSPGLCMTLMCCFMPLNLMPTNFHTPSRYVRSFNSFFHMFIPMRMWLIRSSFLTCVCRQILYG
jgi:hypothetical protein